MYLSRRGGVEEQQSTAPDFFNQGKEARFSPIRKMKGFAGGRSDSRKGRKPEVVLTLSGSSSPSPHWKRGVFARSPCLYLLAVGPHLREYRLDSKLIDRFDPSRRDPQPDPTTLTGNKEAMGLQVRLEAPPGLVVRMRNIVAGHCLLTGHLTFSWHDLLFSNSRPIPGQLLDDFSIERVHSA